MTRVITPAARKPVESDSGGPELGGRRRSRGAWTLRLVTVVHVGLWWPVGRGGVVELSSKCQDDEDLAEINPFLTPRSLADGVNTPAQAVFARQF